MTKPKAAAAHPQPASAAAAKIADAKPGAGLAAPTFKEPPRYVLLEKAWFPTVKVLRDDEWVPYNDIHLDPEEQPLVQQLSGPFGGRGQPKRVPIHIEYLGIPDEHMDPKNEAANWMMDHIDELKAEASKAAAGRRRGRGRNPIDALTIVGAGATVLKPATEAV